MDYVNLLLALMALVAYFALAFVVFHICRFLLDKVNFWRQCNEKKPFSDRLITVLSVLSGLSFLL